MIEINKGTLEERIIKILQKTYPITVKELKYELHLSIPVIERTLKKLQIQGIVQLDILPDKTYMRLIRNDFSFILKKQQKKFIKHQKVSKKQEIEEYNGYMYS